MIQVENKKGRISFFINNGEFIAHHEYKEELLAPVPLTYDKRNDFFVKHSKDEKLVALFNDLDDTWGEFKFPEGEIFIGEGQWLLNPTVGDMLVIDEWTVGQLLSAINKH